MLQMPYPKIIAFVEGHMERLFINNNFHYVSVVTVSNGIGWTTAAMANQITTLYKARNFDGDAVIVWIDREKRNETAEEIYRIIREALIEIGADESKIHILIADRMSENLILSDESLMREYLGDPNYVYDSEGSNGKHRLSELIKGLGRNYKETAVGSPLLKRLRLGECIDTSPAVARFLQTLQIPCWWLGLRT